MNTTSGRAPDPRPLRTRAAIYAAAREMGESRTEVTVNALARRAGVSRAAFYSHFSSLDDVVSGIISDRLAQARERYEQEADQDTPVPVQVHREVLRMSRYVAAHRSFIASVLTWRISHRAYATLVDEFAEQFEYAYAQLPDGVPSHVDPVVTARFHAGGVAEIHTDWLRASERAGTSAGTDCETAVECGDMLAERVLRALPTWLTGIEPGAPIPAVEL